MEPLLFQCIYDTDCRLPAYVTVTKSERSNFCYFKVTLLSLCLHYILLS